MSKMERSGVSIVATNVTALAAQAEQTLKQGLFAGHMFVFLSRRGDLIKIIWWDSQAACLFSKHLEKEVRFVVGNGA